MIEPHRVAETATFVASLPRTGVVVFVMDKADACLVRDLRTALHGVDAMASTHVLVAPTESDEALLMRGRPDDIPVFREPGMVERRNMAAMSVVGDMADEPMVPRREPAAEARCTCGRRAPGWCESMLCHRRPDPSDTLGLIGGLPLTSVGGGMGAFLGGVGFKLHRVPPDAAAAAEVSLGAAPQILDLMEAGFTFTEASGLPDAERDLYAQLVRERARQRERELARRPRAVFA